MLSVRSIEKYMRGSGLPCSPTTISKYPGYLEEAFAIESVKRYSAKAKRQLEFVEKVYGEDVSCNSILVFDGRYDLTHNFGNVVYNELVFRGYHLEVCKDAKGEIDFVASKGTKQYLIQVAYSVAEEKACAREFGAFARLDNKNQKIVIPNDELDYSTSTVRHIRFKDFVWMNDL